MASTERAAAQGRAMAEMFAAVGDLYARYWHEFFHFALFETPGESWEAAFDRTHRRYIADVRAEQAEEILVVACGRGRFAEVIATACDGAVLGIDISEAQLEHARALERSNLQFERLDVMEVERLQRTFDAVVCVDAACYFPDKEAAVRTIARVMRPGARLLLVDWCRRRGLTRLQRELVLSPFMSYWAVPNLATPQAYERYVARSGLRLVRLEDLNEAAAPNWEFAYRTALEAVRDLSEESLGSLVWKGMNLGPRGIRLIKNQFPAALYIRAAFDLGFLRYTSVLAEKV